MGYKPTHIDLKDIEARVAAFVEAQGDLHVKKAAEFFGVSEDKVSPEMRRVGKTLNYLKIYGERYYDTK